jgi:glucose-1-phosphatase
MNSLRCTFLDLGKVLVDYESVRFGECVQSLTGIEVARLRPLLRDLAIEYECGRMTDTIFHGELCRRFGRDVSWGAFTSSWNSMFLPRSIIPDELLARLVRRTDLWVISNTNPVHFNYIRRHYSFVRYLRGFILSYEVGAMKPDPVIFRNALARAGCEASEALFVDDSAENIEAARKLGIDAFQFVDAVHLEGELHRRGLLD